MMRLRIRELREQIKLTQEQLSERCDIARISVARHEANTAGWTSHTVESYAKGFGVPDYVIFGYDLPPTRDLPAAHRELATLLPQLDESTVRVLLRVAKAEQEEKASREGAK